MRRQPILKIVIGILAIVGVTCTLDASAAAHIKFKTLHVFTENNSGGSYPVAGLIFDAAGNLYGTTSSGGSYGAGTVFKLAPNADGSWTESVIYAFTGGSDGGNPVAGLILDSAGALYGTTEGGGDSGCQVIYVGCGVVFKLTPTADGSWSESVLYSFTPDGVSGAFPEAGLIFDGAGNLYGTTSGGGTGFCEVNNTWGCGTVFKLAPNADGSWTESVLYSFYGGYPDGAFPQAGLVFDAAGNLYGTCPIEGSENWLIGMVFELTPNSDGTWTESTIHIFYPNWNGVRVGGEPYAGLIIDAAGNLYGTLSGFTVIGGYGPGAVFKLTPRRTGGWKYSLPWIFQPESGATPLAGLVHDAVGNLYGTASTGGAYGYGVVFRLKPAPNGLWRYSVVWAFQGKSGASPAAGLVLDSAGDLYGTTRGDGKTTFGSVFAIAP